MPTYHFRCDTCSKETEENMSFGSTDKPMCDVCKKSMTKFIVSPHVHFKGSGFYKNDSATQPTKPKPIVDSSEKKTPETAKPAADSTTTTAPPAEKKAQDKKSSSPEK